MAGRPRAVAHGGCQTKRLLNPTTKRGRSTCERENRGGRSPNAFPTRVRRRREELTVAPNFDIEFLLVAAAVALVRTTSLFEGLPGHAMALRIHIPDGDADYGEESYHQPATHDLSKGTGKNPKLMANSDFAKRQEGAA